MCIYLLDESTFMMSDDEMQNAKILRIGHL